MRPASSASRAAVSTALRSAAASSAAACSARSSRRWASSAATARLLRDAGCRVPLLCGPMYPGSNPELVAAVSRAGALGIVQPLSLTHLYGYDFREGLRKVKAEADGRPFGVNITIVPDKRYMKRVDEWMRVALEEDVKFFLTSLGKPDALVKLAHDHGAKVYHDVHTAELARRAAGAGADGVNLLNDRMGGQTGATDPFALLDEVAELDLGVPLVCSGGVADEAAFAAALDRGYGGCMMGTRFLATDECAVSDAYKAAIVASGEADIVYTNKLAGTKSSVIRTPTIEAGGLNVNPLFGFLLKQPMTKNLMRVFLLQRSLANYKDTTLEIWQAGKGVGAIDRVEPVAAVVDRFAAQLAR